MKVNMKQEVKNLEKWLENNLASKMAYLLGYKNSGTIIAWVDRGSIPPYQVERIREIIQKGETRDQQLASSAG